MATSKDSFDAQVSVALSLTQQCIISKNSTKFLQSIEKLIDIITKGCELSLIGPQDFIKLVSIVRDSICASSSAISYDDATWTSSRRQLFLSIAASANLTAVKAPFKGSISEIISAFGNLHLDTSISNIQDLIENVRVSPPETTSKFDLLKFDLILIYVSFGVDYLFSTRSPSESSLEQQVLPCFSSLGNLIDKQLTSSLSQDVTIRSRQFKSIQKTLQGFLALFEGFRSSVLQVQSICCVMNACVNNAESILTEFSTWDNILKNVYTSIKRMQTMKNDISSYNSLFESIGAFLTKFYGLFESFTAMKKDGNTSSADLVKMIVYVVLLLLEIPFSISESANYLCNARLFWQTARMLQLSKSNNVCPYIGMEYHEKMHKILQCCAAHSMLASQQSESLSITISENFLSADISLLTSVLGYIWQEARCADNTSVLFSTGCESLSAKNFLQVFSLPGNSKNMKKMLSILLDILLLPKIQNSSQEDVKLLRQDALSLFGSSEGKKHSTWTQEEETILMHIISWWNEDVLLLRYSCLSSVPNLSDWFLSPLISNTKTALVASPATYLCTTYLSCGLSQQQQQLAMESSIFAINVLRFAESLWLNQTDTLSNTKFHLTLSSSEWTKLTEYLLATEKYISDARNQSRVSKNGNGYCVSPLWQAAEEQQSYLTLLDTAAEQVKPILFQPYADYYLIKSWLWLLGSKVMWFAFDNLSQAEICVKKAFSYAHNRSVQDTILTRWLRVETLLFQGEIVENLGKTSRAVESIVDACSIAMPVTEMISQPFISSKLTKLVFTSAMRHWLRIESTRLQNLVSSHIQEPAMLDVVQYLSTISTSFQSNLQKNNWHFTISDTPNCPDILPDLDILWQQSFMIAPSEIIVATISKNFSTPNDMLRYSLQCPFPLTRHLRKQAAIKLALLSQDKNTTQRMHLMYQSFVAGASSSFVTLERHNGNVAGGVSDSVSLIHKTLTSHDAWLDDKDTTTLFHWFNSLTRFPDIPDKKRLPMQVIFLTFDAVSDDILAGVFRHTPNDADILLPQVEVQSLSGTGRALQSLTQRWKVMLQHHHDLLRVAKDLTTVTQMTQQEKLQWWKQRERMEEDIEQLLRDCEMLLAPLLSFLFPFLALAKKYNKSQDNKFKPSTTASKSHKKSLSAQNEINLSNGNETEIAIKSTKKKSVLSGSLKTSHHKQSMCHVDDDDDEEEDDGRKERDRTKALTSSMKQLRFFDDEDIGLNEDESRDYGQNDDEFDRLVATANENEIDLEFPQDFNHVLDSPSFLNTNKNVQQEQQVQLQQQYEAMKVNELKILCKEKGVSVTGKKSELIERLRESDNNNILATVVPAGSTTVKKSKSIAFQDVDSAVSLPPPPHFSSSSATAAKALFQATPSKASLLQPPFGVKEALLTATKTIATTATATSIMKTTAKKLSSSLLVTAQKSTGKRLIDVFHDEDCDDYDNSFHSNKHNSKNMFEEENDVDHADPAQPPLHTILLLDEQLQQLPVECIPFLKKASISRMLSLPLLVDILLRHKNPNKENTDKSTKARKAQHVSDTRVLWTMPTVSAAKGWFSLDAENNLPTTRTSLLPLLQEAQQRWQWPGYIGEIPSPETAGGHQRNQEVFVYCGHGAGVAFHGLSSLTANNNTASSSSLTTSEVTQTTSSSCALPAAFLWGCSSGRLLFRGDHDPTGPALQYFLAGAPYFLLGNLWDVTDRDLDRLTAEVMKQLFGLTASMGSDDINAFVSSSSLQSTKKVLFQDDDEEEEEDEVDQNKDTGNKNKTKLTVVKKKKSSAQEMQHISQCLAKAREVCKMRFAVGAAAVVYGIPVTIDI